MEPRGKVRSQRLYASMTSAKASRKFAKSLDKNAAMAGAGSDPNAVKGRSSRRTKTVLTFLSVCGSFARMY